MSSNRTNQLLYFTAFCQHQTTTSDAKHGLLGLEGVALTSTATVQAAATPNMSSTAASSLPHRSIANIRTETGTGLGGPAVPHTPSRNISSTFGSPSSLRAEDENILIELGSRFIKLGFAGESAPKAILSLGPEQLRRVGDFRTWDSEHKDDWRRRPVGKNWGADHELWQYDVRTVDLGLVEDKIDRAIREALNKCAPPRFFQRPHLLARY